MGSRTHGVWSNNGGRDAPLTPRARTVFLATLVCIVVVGTALIALARV